jgi:hypothetical protein
MTELDPSFYVGVVLCILGVAACLFAAWLSHSVYRAGIEKGRALEAERIASEGTASVSAIKPRAEVTRAHMR